MIALFMFCLISICSFANTFENGFNKHDGESHIIEYAIMGERCSGRQIP
jgi:hypothetical protein